MSQDDKFEKDGVFAVPEFYIRTGTASLKGIIKEILLNMRWSYAVEDHGGVIFFESVEHINSKIHRDMYALLRKQISPHTYVYPVKKDNFCFFKAFKLYCGILKELRSEDVHVSLYTKLDYLKAKLELEKIKDFLKLNRGKVLVTYCDVTPIDALVTQYAKVNGIKTVTLQHGHFNAKDRPWVFNKSKSDHFLMHGRYAVEEALESGHAAEGLIPVGMMNCIGKQPKSPEIKKEIKKFAIFLNGPGAKEDNEDLIRCANEICRKYQLKYIVRSHPAIPVSVYDKLIDGECCERESKKDESIEELLEEIQFAIVGNSTVFIESLYLGKLTCRFVDQAQDIYEKITWCAFKNIEEFSQLYDLCIRDSDYFCKQVMSTVSYLCEPGDIAENYRKAFEEILSEG